MRDYPPKKTFVQDFVSKGAVAFSVRYDQATLAEFFEFTAKDPETRMEEVIESVRAQLPTTRKERIMRKIFPRYATRFERSVDWPTVVSSVVANRFRSYDSAFDSVPSQGK